MSDNTDARILLAESLYNDPKLRPKFLALVKEKHPQAPIPELDVRDAARAEIEPLRAEIEKERKAIQEERNERWRQQQRAMIVPIVGESNVTAVEKMMTDEAIGTYKAAADLWVARNRVAEPRSAGNGLMQVPGVKGAGGEEFKGLVEDRDGWARERAHEMIADFRNGHGHKWAGFAG